MSSLLEFYNTLHENQRLLVRWPRMGDFHGKIQSEPVLIKGAAQMKVDVLFDDDSEAMVPIHYIRALLEPYLTKTTTNETSVPPSTTSSSKTSSKKKETTRPTKKTTKLKKKRKRKSSSSSTTKSSSSTSKEIPSWLDVMTTDRGTVKSPTSTFMPGTFHFGRTGINSKVDKKTYKQAHAVASKTKGVRAFTFNHATKAAYYYNFDIPQSALNNGALRNGRKWRSLTLLAGNVVVNSKGTSGKTTKNKKQKRSNTKLNI